MLELLFLAQGQLKLVGLEPFIAGIYELATSSKLPLTGMTTTNTKPCLKT